MKDKHKLLLKATPVIIFGIIIFILSSIERKPTTGITPPIASNEVLHICEYGLFSMLLMFGFYPKIKYYDLILISFLYAISDEVHQYFVPTRYFDIIDIFYDCVGIVLGVIMFFILLGMKKILDNLKDINYISLTMNLEKR